MLTDPIADMLTRIRNAQKAEKTNVFMSYSKTKESILKTLKKYKFILDYAIEENGKFQELNVRLVENGEITFTRVSKPGRRIYVKNKDIKRVKSGLGIQIISTPKGIISNEEARKSEVGGEVICEVY